MKLSAEFHKVLDSKLMRKAANHKKTILLTVLAVLSAVSIMSVGPTYAYLKMNGASKAENSFSAAPNVETTLNSDYSVTVSDSGYSVYVRAIISVSWQNSEGQYFGVSPVNGVDYSLSTGDNWGTPDGNGIYYYNAAVESGGTTDPLIESYSAINAHPQDSGLDQSELNQYSLVIEVRVQTLQTIGVSDDGVPAPEHAWGWTPPAA